MEKNVSYMKKLIDKGTEQEAEKEEKIKNLMQEIEKVKSREKAMRDPNLPMDEKQKEMKEIDDLDSKINKEREEMEKKTRIMEKDITEQVEKIKEEKGNELKKEKIWKRNWLR